MRSDIIDNMVGSPWQGCSASSPSGVLAGEALWSLHVEVSGVLQLIFGSMTGELSEYLRNFLILKVSSFFAACDLFVV